MKEEKVKKTNEENVIKEEKTYEIKSNKKTIIALSCIGIIGLLIFIFSIIFALINLNNSNIISGIKVNGIEISNLSKEEAVKKLNEMANQKLNSDILIKAKNFEYGLKLSQIETTYNIEKALEEAYNTGRSGNIFTNNYEIIKTMLVGKNINLEYTYNEELLNKLLNSVAAKVPNSVVEANYCIEDDKLIITKGTKGNTINEEFVKQGIINEILSSNQNVELAIELVEKEPEPIDIDKIYKEVHTEPKDAYYTKEPFQIFPHVDGIDFDVKAAKELLKEDKKEYEIQLTITTPKVTTNQIGTEAFPDLLSSFSTRYDASNYPRTTNLRLAMGKLDGVVVAPGEICSYNQTLGKRTVEAGYQYAGGYAASGVVQTLAGGICQISSTLYDAVVYANLDIIERHNHMYLAGYVGAGKDATVVYGALDFKFKNTRKYPIMIKTSIGNGVAQIYIYGIKEDVEYDVDIETSILSYIPFDVIYEEDKSLAEGQEKVEQSGMNGCRSITYKVVKDVNGNVISRTVLSSDTYDPMNKIIKVGPKKSVQTTTKPETTKPNSAEKNEDKKQETTNNKPSEPTKPNSSTTKPNTNTTQKPSTTEPNTGSNSGGNTGNQESKPGTNDNLDDKEQAGNNGNEGESLSE